MKPLPTTEVSGNTPWERLDSALRAAFSVPKSAIGKKAAKKNTKKRTAKKK